MHRISLIISLENFDLVFKYSFISFLCLLSLLSSLINFNISDNSFALLIEEGGVLIGKGLVNTREHLESLVEARETGISTLQEYMKTQESDLAKEA